MKTWLQSNKYLLKNINIIVIVICLLTSHYRYGCAQDNKEEVYKFAEILFQTREYYRAITEYYRFIQYYPGDIRIPKAYIKIAEAYLYGEQYEDAIKWSNKILELNDDQDIMTQALVIKGDSYFKLANYNQAIKDYSKILELKPTTHQFIGIANMKRGKTLLFEGKWNEAAEEYKKVPANSIYYPKAQNYSQNAIKGQNIQKKEPPIAGILSIIPGLGYFYTENKQTALASLLVNGLFIWGTYSSFKKDNEGAGYLLGFFSMGFYFGNIYGSIGSAQRYNEIKKKEFTSTFE